MSRLQRTYVRILTPLCGFLLAHPAMAAADNDQNIETVIVRENSIKDRHEMEQALTPGGVTLVDAADLQDRAIGSLADLLRFVPGVWSASNYGADDLFISSRGSNLDATNYDMNGVKLLVDGLPVTTADGNNHNRTIDPLSARFASVARGANALTYGASTLGGAVDFVSPNARNSESISASILSGSHGLQQGMITLGRVFDDEWDAQITLESKQREGYRDHSEQSRSGFYGNIGWQPTASIGTRFYLTALDNDQELPGALSTAQFDTDPDQAAVDAVTGNYQRDVKTLRVANKTTFIFDNNASLDFGLSFEKQSLHHPIVAPILVDFDGPGPLQPQEVFSLLIDTDHKDIGAMVRYNMIKGDHDLLFGLNWGENEVEGGNHRNLVGKRNGLATIVDNDAQSTEVFALDRWSINDDWKLVYGFQAVSAERNVKNITVASGAVRNPSETYHSINPRLGVIYQLSAEISLYSNLSRLFEAPTNFELEDDVSASNETLDAMTGTVFEIGSRGTGNRGELSWHWDVSLYQANINDEILSRDDPLAPGTSLTTNVDDTVHRGIEVLFGASYPLANGRIDGLISYTLNRFKFDGDLSYGDNELPAAPGFVIRGEAIYRAENGLFAGPTFDIVDKRYADFSNSYEVDDYHLIGFRAGYKAESWELFLEGKNLTDEEYVVTHSVKDIATLTDEILNAGEPRSVYVGFRLGL